VNTILPNDAIYRNFFVAFFLGLVALSFFIIRPFLAPVVLGGLLAYTAYPLYKLITRKNKRVTLAAAFVSFVLILFVSIPVFTFAQSSVDQARYLYVRTKQIFYSDDPFKLGCAEDDQTYACRIARPLQTWIQEPNVRIQIQGFIERAANLLNSSILQAVPTFLLNAFVMFFCMFYFLRDGPYFVETLKELLPLKSTHKELIFRKLDRVIGATVYGNLMVALVQGLLAGLGYFIAGVPSPFVLAMLTAFFALLPILGTAFVWIPATLFLILSGLTEGHPGAVGWGVALAIYSLIVVSTIDNVLRPKFIGSHARIHPMVVLLGAVGGLAAFGLVGFLLGPVILAMVATLIDIYETERESGLKNIKEMI